MAERSSRREGTRGRRGCKDAKVIPDGQDPTAQENVSLQLIADKLDHLTWRHSLWGVDEREVWHVVERLDQMYRQLYREQQVRYEALLQQARSGTSGSVAVPGRQSPPVSPRPTNQFHRGW